MYSHLSQANQECGRFANIAVYFSIMAKSDIEIGPTGRAVAERVRQVRNDARRWTLNQLSERTGLAGRRLSVSALSLIETGKRRVDVDDLVALADALEVSAAYLLGESLPDTAAIMEDPVLMRKVFENVSREARRLATQNPGTKIGELRRRRGND